MVEVQTVFNTSIFDDSAKELKRAHDGHSRFTSIGKVQITKKFQSDTDDFFLQFFIILDFRQQAFEIQVKAYKSSSFLIFF